MIYLMAHRYPAAYDILNSETDYIGAMHDGKPCIMNTECIAASESITALLHYLQDLKDGKWYVECDWMGSDGKYRHDEYPMHQGLNRLDGYVKEVCDIRIDDKCYLRDFEIEYVSELWRRVSDNQMLRVMGFNKNMLLEVRKFAEEQKMRFRGGKP